MAVPGYIDKWQKMAFTVAKEDRTNNEKSRFKGRRRRRFKITTDSGSNMSVANNVLGRNFIAGCPDEKWAADITYIHTYEGYLYLAAVMDLTPKRSWDTL